MTPDREAAAGLVERPNEEGMIDHKYAAGLVMRLESIAEFQRQYPYEPVNEPDAIEKAAAIITALLSELGRAKMESDETVAVHAHVAAASATRYIAAEARALKAEKERDNLKLQAQGHAMEARSANATIYDAYQAVTGATGEPGNWNGAEPIKAELDRLRALVAEAVRICEPFEHEADEYPLKPDNERPEGIVWFDFGHLRAARAFIDRAKES